MSALKSDIGKFPTRPDARVGEEEVTRSCAMYVSGVSPTESRGRDLASGSFGYWLSGPMLRIACNRFWEPAWIPTSVLGLRSRSAVADGHFISNRRMSASDAHGVVDHQIS